MLVGSISSSGGDSVIGACTDVSGCSACDAVLFSVAVGFFFCGAGFGFGGGLLSFRRSRTVSSRSLFFFLSSSRIAGRSPLELSKRYDLFIRRLDMPGQDLFLRTGHRFLSGIYALRVFFGTSHRRRPNTMFYGDSFASWISSTSNLIKPCFFRMR